MPSDVVLPPFEESNVQYDLDGSVCDMSVWLHVIAPGRVGTAP